MSLDVYLYGPERLVKCQCPDCGNNHRKKERELFYSANITHNLNKMAQEAEIYQAMWRPEEIGAKTARDIIGKLAVGLDFLKNDPERFRPLNPENGWGSYEGLIQFVKDYLSACEENPEATIEVSR